MNVSTRNLIGGFTALAVIVLAMAGARADLTLVAMDGERTSALGAMPHLAGPALGGLDGRVVVIAFFASWCPPCRPEFGHLNTLRKAHDAAKLAIIAVNVFEAFIEDAGAGARMRRFLGMTKPAFSVLGGGVDDEVTKVFGGIDRIPTVLVFDRQGQPAYQFVHAEGATKTHATFEELQAAVAPLF